MYKPNTKVGPREVHFRQVSGIIRISFTDPHPTTGCVRSLLFNQLKTVFQLYHEGQFYW